jgi:hypothetical protein
MENTLAARMAETQSRLQDGKHRLPEIAYRTKTVAATTIGAALTGPGLDVVASYLRAHGVAQINLAERKGEATAVLFTEANLAKQAAAFASDSIRPGNMGLFFNPEHPPDAVTLEHECWRMYFSCAFPKFGQEIGRLGLIMKNSYPELYTFFLVPFVNFYLFSAALHAMRYGFVTAGADRNLTRDLSYLSFLHKKDLGKKGYPNYFRLTAAMVGLTFNYILPFYQSHKDVEKSFTERIGRYFAPCRKEDKNLSEIFDRSSLLAAHCYEACLSKEHSPFPDWTLLTEGIGLDIWNLWQVHIREYFSGIFFQP